MTGMQEPVRLHYDISADDFEAAGTASAAVKKALRQLGFPAEIIRRTSIAMYEGEINTVIHGGGGTADAEIGEDYIRITLHDQGPGIENIDLAMTEGWSTASDHIRELGFGAGMGLVNIQRNSDDLQIISEAGKGTTLTFTIYSNEVEP